MVALTLPPGMIHLDIYVTITWPEDGVKTVRFRGIIGVVRVTTFPRTIVVSVGKILMVSV